ncbi:Tetraspanin family-domain-containing protein [Spinellus fusiger]|nr:Tetraspanin family-domain-containing protein [Spinellus fusiger]
MNFISYSLSKWYVITTNVLFICLGLGFLIFGLMGHRGLFKGSSLFPFHYFELLAILGGIIVFCALLGVVHAFVRRKLVMWIYILMVLIALVFQVVIGVKVYNTAANPLGYLAPLWSSSPEAYRGQLQSDFNCCGFNNAMDNPSITPTCNPRQGIINLPPCYDSTILYVRSTFSKVYLVIFAALAFELLALSNAVTMLCTRKDTSASASFNETVERHNRRKSGIKLDDMSVPESPTIAGSPNPFTEEHKQYMYSSEMYKSTAAHSSPHQRLNAHDERVDHYY